MINLLLAILTSTGIFICFKFLERFKIDILLAIIVNYITASFCGFLLADTNFNWTSGSRKWIPLSILIGILFIVVFYIIGKSTQKSGVSVTTLASKMSFVLPMMFSILFYKENLPIEKIIGFTIAVASVAFTNYQKQNYQINRKYLWFPVFLFFGVGTVDSLVKFAQEEYLQEGGSEQFSTFLFAIAAISGFIVLLVKRTPVRMLLQTKVIVGGILLGVANFGSLYFLIEALNHSNIDSSIVFSVINIGIVSLSVLIGIGLFKEKLNKVNVLGVLLAFIAIFILTN